ncbi:MAG: hypothetical protein ACRYG4_05555, partial [Janthinobacterium lividum]
GKSFVQAVSTMTGASVDAHNAMMIAGGRSPEGLRSKRAALAEVAAEAGDLPGVISSPERGGGPRASSARGGGAADHAYTLSPLDRPSTMQEHGPPPPKTGEDL